MLRKLSDDESKSLEDSLAECGLPFTSLDEAEKHFFAERDKDLEKLASLNQEYIELKLDYKAQSLKRLEAFYFSCYVDKKIALSFSKEEFELLLTQYMRQVFVSNGMAEWGVFENYFAEGRYDLGVIYGYGAEATEHYAGWLAEKENNKDRTALYDKFMMYVPEERESEVQ